MSNSNLPLENQIIKKIKLLEIENSRRHNTNQYDAAEKFLIVRRGDHFKIKIFLGTGLQEIGENIYLSFQVYDEKRAKEKFHTLVRLRITKPEEILEYTHKWEMETVQIKNKILTLNIKPAADCPVAKWKLRILRGQNSNFDVIYKLKDPIYILFNPWCVDDDVFIEDESHIKEYLLTTTTFIWRGLTNSNSPMLWYLGQYEKSILDCAMFLIEKIAKVIPQDRGYPRKIARGLSAAVNSPEDNGVLVGSWSDYTNGTDPTAWTGSVEILQLYYEKQKPVKYAQCWVFAGVLSTVARALGMPSRVVTNFNSGHDTHGSLLVDEIYNKHGKRMYKLSRDFYWNFHAWNEVWMNRPDLNKNELQNFNGWQVLDPTPSETSSGVYCLGPASVKAVKIGEISKPYDSGYVYAAVNADIVTWEFHGNNLPLKLLSVDTEYIGQNISTKAVGKWEREDITSFYKFAEKTKQERITMSKSLSKSKHLFAKLYLRQFKYITFKLIIDEKPFIGDPFMVAISIHNVSKKKSYAVTGSLKVVSASYNRIHTNAVKANQFFINLGPQQTRKVEMEVAFEDYYPKLSNQAMFKVSSRIAIKNTNYTYYVQENFNLLKPDIQFELENIIAVHQPISVTVSLKNPLPVTLHKGYFRITGSKIQGTILLTIDKVKPGETTKMRFEYTPLVSGIEIIGAKFNSTELQDIDGHLVLEIPQQSNLHSHSAISLIHFFSTE